MNALVPILRRNWGLGRAHRSLFDSFFDDWNLPSFFESESAEVVPSIDVSETEDALIVKAEIPGMKKEDINLTFTDGLLTISGEKREEREDEKENFRIRESRFGSFSRTMRLPADVDAEKIDAAYKDGVLKITVPKTEAARSRKIEIAS